MPQTGLHCIIPLCLCAGVCSLSPLCRLQVLKRRLESLGESGQQMCHQVSPSVSGWCRSRAGRPSLPVCVLVPQPSLWFLPAPVPLLLFSPPSICVLFLCLTLASFCLWTLCPDFLSFQRSQSLLELFSHHSNRILFLFFKGDPYLLCQLSQ